MNTTAHTTAPAVTVPAITTQIADLVDDLTGFHPTLDRAVNALGDLLTADLTADQSQSVVAVLGGLADGSLATLLGLVIRQVANPDANPALAGLDDGSKRTLRRLGAEYAAGADDPGQQYLASEMSAVIDGA